MSLMLWAGRRRWLCEAIACWNHLGTSDEFLNAKDAKCFNITKLCIYYIRYFIYFIYFSNLLIYLKIKICIFGNRPGPGRHVRECGVHSEEAHAHLIFVQRNPGASCVPLFTVPLISWPSCPLRYQCFLATGFLHFASFCLLLLAFCLLYSFFSGALHQKHGSKQTLTAQVLQVLLWKFQVDAHGMGWETKSSHSSDLRNSRKAGLESDWKGELAWNYVPSLQWIYRFHKAPIDFVGSMFLTCSSWHQYPLQQTRLVFHGDAGDRTQLCPVPWSTPWCIVVTCCNAERGGIARCQHAA